ncbi:aminotransferase class IV [Gloeocapsa sp. PCC 73106]|uniref:aminotransferase class IV n=1 Tax=Gloeocapsa sp. PCC 73106 TaxID=102232 RepID=UPI0002AD0C79|nr:aminotransferase class IV [Gloeocapsa sp. PCC 73106]ELR96802.1 branched-chain amino acid aminotransferase/4-amino-4-deoxychorismate lyase [Gloeocapsa sp. PCC 73106]
MYWYKGELLESPTLVLEIDDPALLYGATVFTTLRVYGEALDHPLTHWQQHCDRLRHTLVTLGWSLPHWTRLREGATILKKYPVLRLTIFPDGRELILPRALPPNLQQMQQHGIKGEVIRDSLYRRYLPEHKTGNYLGPWLARTKAQQSGYQEAILTDTQGNWLETTTGNLWGYRDRCWYTPLLDQGMLPGIAQQALIQWLKQQDIPVVSREWSPDWVDTLEAIAYSNSVLEVIPFISINNRQLLLKLDYLAPLRQYFTNFSLLRDKDN